jgi:hypothetical protein
MTERAKVVELFRPMQNSHYPQYNRRAFSYAYHNAYVLKTMPFQSTNGYMVSGPKICASHSFTIVSKPKQ